MFARSASIRLKPNVLAEFCGMMEREAVPVLRRQKGFQDEITFFVPGGCEAIEISLWDRREDADAYGSKVSPELLKALVHVIEGDIEVRTYEVSNSTFHKIAPPVFV